MQHCRRRRRGCISFRRPGMKWEERDEDSEADKKQQINMALRIHRDLTQGGGGFQREDIKATRFNWNALIKQNQTEQQNEDSNRDMDLDLPGDRGPVSAAQDRHQ